jgi:hypothetical protein
MEQMPKGIGRKLKFGMNSNNRLWVRNAPHLLQLQRLHSNVQTAAYNSVFPFNQEGNKIFKSEI